MANQIPRPTGSNATATFAENAINTAPHRLDVDVSSADADFAGGTLTVAGLLAEDRVGLATDDIIGVWGASLLYRGTVVGTPSDWVFANFAQVRSQAVQVGADVVITVGADHSLTLQNVALKSLAVVNSTLHDHLTALAA